MDDLIIYRSLNLAALSRAQRGGNARACTRSTASRARSSDGRSRSLHLEWDGRQREGHDRLHETSMVFHIGGFIKRE